MHLTRRDATLGALGACAARGDSLEGRPIYSESVMLSGADPEGRCFAAVRACTYPEASQAWLWCMLLTPDGFWQFARNDIAWEGAAVAPTPDGALYSVAADGARPARAIFAREGALAAPTRATLAAGFDSDPRLGETGAPVAAGNVFLEAVFTPAAGHGGLLPNRTESFGHAGFRGRIGDRAFAFEGPAQFHEQPQHEPRFTTPFVFSSLWSADLFATVLHAETAAGGYVIDRGRVHMMANVRASVAPGALGIDFTLDAGDSPRRFALESARDYRVPVYEEYWRGRFVRGVYDGRRVVGFLNSWRR